MAKRKTPRRLSLVKFNAIGFSAITLRQHPLKQDATYIFFGEIPNMPDHCVVADHRTGKLFSGYHTDHFIELKEDET